ncbi:MAG: ABC-F family ATP-binding cassette domain-containing protein [Spirochaetia bacterium]
MSLVQLNKLSHGFGDTTLLKDASFSLGAGDRVALVGPNGSGKTTLMRLIAGHIEPDSGNVVTARRLRVAYLPQTGVAHAGRSLYEEADSAFAEGHALADEHAEVTSRLEQLSSDNDRQLQAELSRLHDVQEQIESSGYYEREERIHKVLRGLGFLEDQFESDCSTFSGGKQMRIALAGILLREPDVLLLDEPTNYLDLETRNWLLEYLLAYRGGVLLVSHDRFFLDAWATEVVELFGAGLKRYKGNYTRYEQRRAEDLQQLTADYERQQDQIRKLENFITRFRYNASKAKLVQSRVKELERITPIELPEGFRPIKLRLPAPPRSGSPVVELANIARSYNGENGSELRVIENLNLEFERGEKVALVGPNGAGKSTLMRILAHRDQRYSGSLAWGKDVHIGFFSEDLLDELQPEDTVLSIIERAAPTEVQPAVRDLLGAFLFKGDDIFKPFGVLSGGERTRLAMLRMLLRPINLLVLDEPTNHLDLVSKDVLLQALRDYSGTVVFVSHDRHFLESLAGRVVALEPQPNKAAEVKSYPGPYSYYQQRREAELSVLTGTASAAASGGMRRSGEGSAGGQGERVAISTEAKSEVGTAASNYQRQKFQKAELRKLERTAEASLAQLDQLESEREQLESQLSQPEVYTDGEAVKDIRAAMQRNEAQQLNLTERWEHAENTAAELRTELGL